MTPAIYNSKGRLTSYGLSCGYVEQKKLSNGCEIKMYMEHGVINIRAFNPDRALVMWDYARHVTAARAAFDQFIKNWSKK